METLKKLKEQLKEIKLLNSIISSIVNDKVNKINIDEINFKQGSVTITLSVQYTESCEETTTIQIETMVVTEKEVSIPLKIKSYTQSAITTSKNKEYYYKIKKQIEYMRYAHFKNGIYNISEMNENRIELLEELVCELKNK